MIMLDFIYSLGLFWLEALGLIIFVIGGLLLFLVVAGKAKEKAQRGILVIENITEEFDEQKAALEAETLDKKALKLLEKERKKESKSKKTKLKSAYLSWNLKGT